MKRLDRQSVTPRSAAPAPSPVSPSPAASAPEGASASSAAMLRIAVAALVLAAPPLLAWGAWTWLTRTPGLAVRSVAISGVVNASQQELVARSGAVGRNVFALDLADVRQRLLSDPWIADASVRRALPHGLRVAVVERAPAALEQGADSLRVLDGEGRVLAEGVAAGAFPLPVLTGIDAAAEDERAARRELGARTLAALHETAPSLFARAESLDVSQAERLVLTARDAPPLWLSGPASADEAAAWSRRENGIVQAIDRAAWVDARWRDRLYVMPIGLASGARR
jgi:hypothetical protein